MAETTAAQVSSASRFWAAIIAGDGEAAYAAGETLISLPPVSTPGFDFLRTSVVGVGETASMGAAALSAAGESSDLAPMLV